MIIIVLPMMGMGDCSGCDASASSAADDEDDEAF